MINNVHTDRHYRKINPFRAIEDHSLSTSGFNLLLSWPASIKVLLLLSLVSFSYILFRSLYFWPQYPLICFLFFNHSLLFTQSINILHWNVLAKTFSFLSCSKHELQSYGNTLWMHTGRNAVKLRRICRVHFKFKVILLIQSNPCESGEHSFSSACLPDLQW